MIAAWRDFVGMVLVGLGFRMMTRGTLLDLIDDINDGLDGLQP